MFKVGDKVKLTSKALVQYKRPAWLSTVPYLVVSHINKFSSNMVEVTNPLDTTLAVMVFAANIYLLPAKKRNLPDWF